MWICLNNFLDQTSRRGQILTKTFFSPKREPHTAKQCFSVFLYHFWGNSQRTSLCLKSDYLRKEHRNTQKVCFTYEGCKGANPDEYFDFFKQMFMIKPVK